jgi:hypothetical protein
MKKSMLLSIFSGISGGIAGYIVSIITQLDGNVWFILTGISVGFSSYPIYKKLERQGKL